MNPVRPNWIYTYVLKSKFYRGTKKNRLKGDLTG